MIIVVFTRPIIPSVPPPTTTSSSPTVLSSPSGSFGLILSTHELNAFHLLTCGSEDLYCFCLRPGPLNPHTSLGSRRRSNEACILNGRIRTPFGLFHLLDLNVQHPSYAHPDIWGLALCIGGPLFLSSSLFFSR